MADPVSSFEHGRSGQVVSHVLFLLCQNSHWFLALWQVIGHQMFGCVAFGFSQMNGSFHVSSAVNFPELFLQSVFTQKMKCVQLMFS